MTQDPVPPPGMTSAALGQDPKPLPPEQKGARLVQSIAQRRRSLIEQGMPKKQALRAAVGETHFLLTEQGEHWAPQRSALQSYLDGKGDVVPSEVYNWKPIRLTSEADWLLEHPEDARTNRNLFEVAQSYVFRPLLTGVNRALGGFTDIVTGVAGMEPVDIKSAVRASLWSSSFSPSDTWEQRYRKLQKLDEIAQQAAPGGRVLNAAANVAGHIAQFMPVTLTGQVLKGGYLLGSKASQFVARSMGARIAPKVAEKIAGFSGAAAGFGLVNALSPHRTAEESYDEETGKYIPPGIDDRLKSAAWGMAAGAAFHGLGEVGRTVASSMLRRFLDKRYGDAAAAKAQEAFKAWASQHPQYKESYAAAEKEMQRLRDLWTIGGSEAEVAAGLQQAAANLQKALQPALQEYITRGMPGMSTAAMKASIVAARGSIEAAGLSLLDADFRSNLWQGTQEMLQNGDPEKLMRAMEQYAGTALGIAVLHGYSMGRGYEWMRGMPRGSRPGQKPDGAKEAGPAPALREIATRRQPPPEEGQGPVPVRPEPQGPGPAGTRPEPVADVDTEIKQLGQQPSLQESPGAKPGVPEDVSLRGEDLARMGWQEMSSAMPDARRFGKEGSSHWFYLRKDGEMARPSRELADMLGIEPSWYPVGPLLDHIYVGEILTQLIAKSTTGGMQLDTEGTFGVEQADKPSMLYRITFGDMRVREAAPDSEWREPTPLELTAIPPAGRSEPSETVGQAVALLEAVREFRVDLPPAPRQLMDLLISSLRSRGESDPGTRDMAQWITAPELQRALAEGSAEAVQKALMTAAEVATVKSPDRVIDDLEIGVPIASMEAPKPTESEGMEQVEPEGMPEPAVEEQPQGQAPKAEAEPGPEWLQQWRQEFPELPGEMKRPEALAERAAAVQARMPQPDEAQAARIYDELRRLEEAGDFGLPFREDLDVTEPSPGLRNLTKAMGQVLGRVKRKSDWMAIAEGLQANLAGPEGVAWEMSPSGQALIRQAQQLGEKYGWPLPEERLEYAMAGINPMPFLEGAARLFSGLPLRVLRYYYEPLIHRMMRLGAIDVANRFKRAMTMFARYQSELEPLTVDYLKKTRFPIRELDRVVWHDAPAERSYRRAGTTMFYAALDAQAGQAFGISDEDMGQENLAIVRQGNRIANHVPMWLEQIGATKEDGTPIRHDPGARIGRRMLTDEAMAAIQQQSGAAWNALIEATADLNPGMSPAMAASEFSPQQTLTVRDATENTRRIPVIPSRIELDNGHMMQVFEDQPFEFVSRLTAVAIPRVAFLSQFGGDLAPSQGAPAVLSSLSVPHVPASTYQMLTRVQSTYGEETAMAVARAIQAMHGIPERPGYQWIGARPGTSEYRIMETISQLYGVWRAFKLSTAFLPNIFEIWASPASLLGMGNLLSAARDFLSELGTNPMEWRSNMVRMLERLRSKSIVSRVDNIENWRISGPSAWHTSRNSMRVVAQSFIKPLKLVSEATAVWIGLAAERAVEDMRQGQKDYGDLLRVMRFSEADAARINAGRGTPIEYGEVLARVEPALMGGLRQQGPEKSPAKLSRGFRTLIPFSDYFQTRALHLASVMKGMKTARTSRQRARAAGRLLKFLGLSVASGAMMTAFMRLLFGGNDSVRQWMNEIAEDPLEQIRLVLMSGLGGGPGVAMWETGKAVAEGLSSSRGLAEAVASTVAGNLGPVSALTEFTQYAWSMAASLTDNPNAASRPYLGMDPMEMTAKFWSNLIPAANRLRRGLFGMEFLGIGQSPTLENAISAYNRWMRQNGKFTDPGEFEVTNTYRELREAAREIRAAGGKLSTPEVREQLRNALKAFGGNEKEFGRRLANRAPIGGSEWEKLSPEEQQSLRRFVGPDYMRVLTAYSNTLRAFEDG